LNIGIFVDLKLFSILHVTCQALVIDDIRKKVGMVSSYYFQAVLSIFTVSPIIYVYVYIGSALTYDLSDSLGSDSTSNFPTS